MSCLLSSCTVGEMRDHWQRFHKQIQSPPVHYEDIPPRNLKNFTPQRDIAFDVLLSLDSEDKFGQQRLQLYVKLAQPIDEALLRRIMHKYQQHYAVIWLYLVQSQGEFSQQAWQAQAAWFNPDVPPARHYLDFEATHHEDNFYWRSE